MPVSLLCKQLDKDETYANPACLALFSASQAPDEFLQSIDFFDALTHIPLAGASHPFYACDSENVVTLYVRVKSKTRNISCTVEGKRFSSPNSQWVVLHVSSAQENDVTELQPGSSPLANHLAFSHLLSSISSQLINVSTENLDYLIEKSLGAFGDFCGVDRCYLFKFSKDKSAMDNTHEWVAAGIEPYKDELQNVSLADLPYFEKIIKQEYVFKVDDVETLPEAAILEKEEFEREGIQSVLCVAVHLNDDLFGFVGCDIVGSAYTWREHDIRYLKLIGEILSNSLESVANRLSLQKVTRALEKANKKLAYLANSDGLTGIANRRQFDDSLEKSIQRGMRERKPISLLMVDVDHFKLFNDTFGHAVGDEAIQRVAKALDACCKRSDDLAARYGGEEFAVILPDTGCSQAKLVAEQIMQAVEDLNISFENSPTKGRLTVSIGIISETCTQSLSSNALVTMADKALYKAKENGRNQVVCKS